jgi:D-3-phosphoglycerate dehydrogenase
VKALLLENVHPLATDILTTAGIEVETRSGALDEVELAKALDGVSLLGIRSKTDVPGGVIRSAPDLADRKSVV